MTKSRQSSSKSDFKQDFDNINYKELLTQLLTVKGTVSAVYNAFYVYSFGNQMLATWQLIQQGLNLTPVLPKTKWAEKGRTIKKGVTPICLCQPRNVRYEKEEIDKETGEKVKVERCFTKFVYEPYWYSYEQTEGPELQEEKAKVPNFDFDAVLKAFKIELVDYNSLNGNCQGYAIPKDNKIAINPMAGNKKKTLLHEIAHCLLQHDKVDYAQLHYAKLKYRFEKSLEEKYKLSEVTDKAQRKELKEKIKLELQNEDFKFITEARDYEHCLKEAEAEGTAFIIGTILGFSEKELSDSRGYVQGWFGRYKNLPEENSQKVIKTVDKMLKAGLVKS